MSRSLPSNFYRLSSISGFVFISVLCFPGYHRKSRLEVTAIDELMEIDSNGIGSDNAELFDWNGGSGQRQAIERARRIQKGENLKFPERLRSPNSLFQARCADEGTMSQWIAPGRNTAQRQRNGMKNRNREVGRAMASPIDFLIPAERCNTW
jgi:hypothetical protein